MGAHENTIAVQVNGIARQLASGTALTDLIAGMQLDRRYLVVEYNGEPLHRDQHESVILGDGDRLELVRPIAGG